MTDTTTKPAGRAPSHIAYHVRDTSKKSIWTRIGCAWPHIDGNGFNIQIEVAPLDGRVSLRIATDKKD